jgi:probable addiction module antidote protein
MHLKEINETFADDLSDPDYVAGYLEAVLEEGDTEAFLIALRNIAETNGGLMSPTKATLLDRESLYKALSEQGVMEFKTIQIILSGLGLRFSVTRAETPAALHV